MAKPEFEKAGHVLSGQTAILLHALKDALRPRHPVKLGDNALHSRGFVAGKSIKEAGSHVGHRGLFSTSVLNSAHSRVGMPFGHRTDATRQTDMLSRSMGFGRHLIPPCGWSVPRVLTSLARVQYGKVYPKVPNVGPNGKAFQSSFSEDSCE